MRKIILAVFALALSAAFLTVPSAPAWSAGRFLNLPTPDTEGGAPLMKALHNRCTNRSIKTEALSEGHLSNLLWSAWGINRPDGRRTAPTSKDEQKVSLYVALESGVWLYDAKRNGLELALAGDYRQRFNDAPATLIFAAPADMSGAMHAGSMYQNAGLYCASAGLANVVKTSAADVLAKSLPLPNGYSILVVQLVGYPK